MSDLPETKRCPYLVAALIPLLGKLSDDVADAGMSCLQDKCAMWRTFEVNKAFSTDGVENIEYVRYTQGWCGLAGKP